MQSTSPRSSEDEIVIAKDVCPDRWISSFSSPTFKAPTTSKLPYGEDSPHSLYVSGELLDEATDSG